MMRAMDYAEAREIFFQPRTGAAPTTEERTPARALRDAIEPIATVSWWSKAVHDAYATRGLDFLHGYAWGRASAMGEARGSVVAAAFGVFEPTLIAGLYDAARASVSLEDIREMTLTGAVSTLEDVLGEPAELPDVVAALRHGLDHADATSRPLFAGLTGVAWPSGALGQLWHATTMLREYRGDGHLAAMTAAGVTGLESNILTELRIGFEPLAYTSTRGWPPEAMEAATDSLAARGLVADGALTEKGTALRDEIEATTDALVAPVVDAIGDKLPGLVTTLDGWAQKLIDAGWFPPDPYKRAAG